MEKFFYPHSMAVIGVSLDKMNLGKIVLLNNRRINFEGNLYGVGRQEGEIEGIHVYQSILSLPEIPDVAIFLTPSETIPSLLVDCGEKGIKRIVIESSGFSEFSRSHFPLETEILKIVNKYEMKVIGPNCIGTMNYDAKVMMPFRFSPGFIPPEGGRVAFIFQSGGVGASLFDKISKWGITPGKFVSIGNKLQLDEADFLKYFLDDPKTDIITVYLEGFKRGRFFHELAMNSEKPIIVQKANQNQVSARVAQSHTSSLSGDDMVVDGAFQQAAIIRVEEERDFINAIKIFRLPLMKGRRVAVLSRSGGHSVLTADACVKCGFEMVSFPESFLSKVRALYHSKVIYHQNPLDLGDVFDYSIFTKIVDEALKLPNVDGVIFNHSYTANNYESEMSRIFLSGVEELASFHQKPISVALNTDQNEFHDIARNSSYPIFSCPMEATTALNVSATYFEQKTMRNARGPVSLFDVDLPSIRSIRDLCKSENRIPFLNESMSICIAAGLTPAPNQIIFKSTMPKRINVQFPVALKLMSRDFSHKSDIGGVRLGIKDKKSLNEAITDMTTSAKNLPSSPRIDGFMIQEMAAEGLECFVGGRRDPVFGPIVMAGVGGIFIEILKDTAIRLAPVTKREAWDMLWHLKAYPLLQGARGKKNVDIAALVNVICRVSSLITSCPDIRELDLNPVIVHAEGEGVSVVDARVFF